MKYMVQLKKKWKTKYMKTIINFVKRLPRLFRKDKEPKLSVAQIEELIELNKDVLVQLDDSKIKPIIKKRIHIRQPNECKLQDKIKPIVKKRKLHDK